MFYPHPLNRVSSDRPIYVAPSTISEASAILSKNPDGAMIIAGGTDLVAQMRAGIVHPGLLVDLRLLGLDEIEVDENIAHIGARVTHTAIIASKIIGERFPALVAACRRVGATPTRNRGTLGGNLANASPAADSALPLLIYDASVVLAGLGGERIVPLSEFFKNYRLTALRPGEIIKEIRLPIPSDKTEARFIKLGKRRAMFIAVVSVAIRLTVDESCKIQTARIALGSVAPIPLLVKAAEGILENQALTNEIIATVAKEAGRVISPISDIRASAEYRRNMALVLVRRALTEILQNLQGAE